MKKRWIALAILAPIVTAGVILSTGKQPQPFAGDSESATRLAPGPHMIHSHEEVFVDKSRPTDPNRDYAGNSVRTLDSSVWHPASAEQGPYPLIVYSHGFSSTKEGGAYLAQHLASYGFVVVAASYPLTNYDAPGDPQVMDVVNQPADVSFLIDTLLKQSSTAGHMLEGMIDSSRIGVTGLSLGGMTTALVSFHPEMRDPRIGAALSIAGPTSMFTSRFFEHADLPFLMLAGDIDALVPYGSNAEPVPEMVDGGELVTIANASHTGFAGPAGALRWMENPDSLGCSMVKDNVDDTLDDEPWYDKIGSPEQGINHNMVNELCLMDPLPEAMNVLRQHMISKVVVTSFFRSHFDSDPAVRNAASVYLSETVAEELAEVSYRN